MPVNAIGATLIAASQKVASGGNVQVTTVATTAQEQGETKATTVKEALQGDPVAKRKLAKINARALQQQQQQAAPPPQPTESGKGALVDHNG